MTKTITPTEKFKKQRDNAKMQPKTSITQRLWTDNLSAGFLKILQIVVSEMRFSSKS